jgi:hypothetical protein
MTPAMMPIIAWKPSFSSRFDVAIPVDTGETRLGVLEGSKPFDVVVTVRGDVDCWGINGRVVFCGVVLGREGSWGACEGS